MDSRDAATVSVFAHLKKISYLSTFCVEVVLQIHNQSSRLGLLHILIDKHWRTLQHVFSAEKALRDSKFYCHVHGYSDIRLFSMGQ